MRHMSNRRRGEVAVVIDGEPAQLRLTLGGLAELESALGAGDLAALGERLSRGVISARDLQLILAAGLRGGGRKISDSEVAALPVAGEIPALAAAAAELLAVTFGVETGAPDEAAGQGGAAGRRAGQDGPGRREPVEAGAGSPFRCASVLPGGRTAMGAWLEDVLARRFHGMTSWLLASARSALRRMFSGR